MSRFRLATGPAALFGAIVLVALIALLPLRLVLGGFDLEGSRIAAREASGSVWAGHLREAEVGGIALGDLDAHLSPWSLLLGRARLELAASGGGLLRGAIVTTRHSVGVDAMTASLPAGATFAPLPISAIDLDGVSATFTDGRCERAAGRVKATLGAAIGGVELGSGLLGIVRCDAGALLLPLASQAGTERITLRLLPSGRFHAEVLVRPIDATAARTLEGAGFQPVPSGERLALDGRF